MESIEDYRAAPTADIVDVGLAGSMFTLEAIRHVPRDLRDVLDPCRTGDREVVAEFMLSGYVLAGAARDALRLLVAACADLSPSDPCPCGSPLQVFMCHGRTKP